MSHVATLPTLCSLGSSVPVVTCPRSAPQTFPQPAVRAHLTGVGLRSVSYLFVTSSVQPLCRARGTGMRGTAPVLGSPGRGAHRPETRYSLCWQERGCAPRGRGERRGEAAWGRLGARAGSLSRCRGSAVDWEWTPGREAQHDEASLTAVQAVTAVGFMVSPCSSWVSLSGLLCEVTQGLWGHVALPL